MTNAASVRLDTCAICHSKTRGSHTDLTFDYGDFKITVVDVPVRTCDECNENFVNGPLGVALSNLVSEIAEEYAPLVQKRVELRGTEVRKSYTDSPQLDAARGQFAFA